MDNISFTHRRLGRGPVPYGFPANAAPAAPVALPLWLIPTALVSLFYLLIIHGRLSETFVRIPYMAFVVGGTALALGALSGGLLRAARSVSGIMTIALTGWLIAAVPFSAWRSGSLEVLTEVWVKSAALFFIVAGTVVTGRLFQSMAGVLTGALIMILIGLKFFGTAVTGRLEMEEGLLGNPNDLATHILITVPFVFCFFEIKGLKSVFGWLALGTALVCLAMVLNTGSRGGLLALLVMGFYRFFRGSMIMKAAIAVAAVVLIVAAPLFMSTESKERYLSLFGNISSEEASSRQVEFAEASAESRLLLLKQSLWATVQHPVFGVGPGVFSAYMVAKLKDEGVVRPLWAQTHNTFTQMSSEGGVVAGLLLIALTFRAHRSGVLATRAAGGQPAYRHIGICGTALSTSVVAFTVAAFFGNYAYHPYVPLLAACGEGLRGIVAAEVPAQPPAMVRPPAFRTMSRPAARLT